MINRLLIISLFIFSGCFRSGTTINYYALEGERCSSPKESPLRVYEFESSPLIQSRLLFANAQFEFGEFQTVRWKDSPGNAIAQALRESFHCSDELTSLKKNVLRVMGRIIRLELSAQYEPVFEVELRVLTQEGLKSKTFVYKDAPLTSPSPRDAVISINGLIKKFQDDAKSFVFNQG